MKLLQFVLFHQEWCLVRFGEKRLALGMGWMHRGGGRGKLLIFDHVLQFLLYICNKRISKLIINLIMLAIIIWGANRAWLSLAGRWTCLFYQDF